MRRLPRCSGPVGLGAKRPSALPRSSELRPERERASSSSGRRREPGALFSKVSMRRFLPYFVSNGTRPNVQSSGNGVSEAVRAGLFAPPVSNCSEVLW